MTIPTCTDDLLGEIEGMDLDSGAVMLSGDHCKLMLARIRELEKYAARYCILREDVRTEAYVEGLEYSHENLDRVLDAMQAQK